MPKETVDKTAHFNEQDVVTFYRHLGHNEKDEFTEIRLIDPWKKLPSKQFFVQSEEEFVSIVKEHNNKKHQIYAGLNPRKRKSGSSEDIARVTCILFDIDSDHPKDESANEKELKNAEKRMKQLLSLLDKRGFQKPLISMSGNGFHVLLRVTIEFEDWEDMTKRLEVFHKEIVSEIDFHLDSMFDLPRICKISGIMSIKGKPSKERPHRLCFVVDEGSMVDDKKLAKDIVNLEPFTSREKQTQDPETKEDVVKLEWDPKGRRRALWPCLEHAITAGRTGDRNKQMLTLLREMWIAAWSLEEVIETIKKIKGSEYKQKKTLYEIERFLKWANKEEDLSLTSCKKLKNLGFKCLRDDCLRAEIRDEKKESVASRITNMVEEDKNIMLFSDDAGQFYAWIDREEHKEVWPIESRSFKRHLARMYRKDTGVVPHASSLRDAVLAISAIADETGKNYTLHNRAVRYDDAIWYDMTNAKWEVIRIDKNGWEILTETPIPLFLRFDHQQPQIYPARNDYSKRRRAHHIRGKILKIMRFHNLQDRPSRILDMAHLGFAYVSNVPHPVTNVHGPAGCGKTKGFHRTTKALIDPSVITEGLPLPSKNRKADLVLQLNRHYYVIYTNLSYLDREMSDALCRAVDGTGDETRRLYTNEEIVAFCYQRNIGINAIPVVATQEDLMDRSLLFGLSALPREKRMDETEIETEFEKVRPEIFGAILDTLSDAMSIRPNINLGYIERLGEFTKWGCAITEALGYEHKDFLEAYAENRRTANEEVLISNLLGNAIMKFMKDRSLWEGTPTELYDTLTEMKYKDKDPAKSWPGNESWMSRDLTRIEQPLYRSGLNVERDRSSGDRTITISWCDGYGPVSTQESLVPSDGNDGNDGISSLLILTEKKKKEGKLLTYENGVTAVIAVTDVEKSPDLDESVEELEPESEPKKPKKKDEKKEKPSDVTKPEWKFIIDHGSGDSFTPKDDDMDMIVTLNEKGYVEELSPGIWKLTDKAREEDSSE